MSDEIPLAFRETIVAQSQHRYMMLQRLGSGGNAVAFLMLATSGPWQGIPFAMKIFRRVSKPERRSRFLEEIAFLRQCNHPGIMRIYDEGVFRESNEFLVAEYLPQTLATSIRSGSLTMAEKLSFSLQPLSALAFLSRLPEPVIHRDIKPQNVFVKGRSCLLGDFGLIKRLTSHEGERDAALLESVGPGMPFSYRSPDQVAYARGISDLSCKSDVFQLGLVLAELFTGRNPERRAENDHLLSDVILDPLGYIPGASWRSIRQLIESMLEFDPARRPSAEELLVLWQGLFEEIAEQSRAIEGRVF